MQLCVRWAEQLFWNAAEKRFGLDLRLFPASFSKALGLKAWTERTLNIFYHMLTSFLFDYP
jgi:hypothetical protein